MVLRLLFVRDQRQLQDEINDVLSQVQQLTADPKVSFTDTLTIAITCKAHNADQFIARQSRLLSTAQALPLCLCLCLCLSASA